MAHRILHSEWTTSLCDRRPRNKHAKAWADHLATTDEYCHHDTEHLDTLREGEIIAWGGGSQMTGGGLITYLQVVGGVQTT